MFFTRLTDRSTPHYSVFLCKRPQKFPDVWSRVLIHVQTLQHHKLVDQDVFFQIYVHFLGFAQHVSVTFLFYYLITATFSLSFVCCDYRSGRFRPSCVGLWKMWVSVRVTSCAGWSCGLDAGLLLVSWADLNLLCRLSPASVVFREDWCAAFLDFLPLPFPVPLLWCNDIIN